MSEVACAYCGKERPRSEMVRGKIVCRDLVWDEWKRRWRNGVVEKTNWYCRDAGCHGKHQMAHEG